MSAVPTPPLQTAPAQDLEARMAEFERRLDRLIQSHARLLDENRQLAEDRRQLRATVDRQREELRSVHQRVKSSAIMSTVVAADGQTAALRNRIDEYVREIERCIAHLNE